MCRWGDTVLLEVTIPAHLSYSGIARRKTVGIDRCIAPIIKALNESGIQTVSCCCGHGNQRGSILLADGRELVVHPALNPFGGQ